MESRSRLQRDSIASTISSSGSTVDGSTDNAVKIKLEKLRRELDIIQSRVMEEREKYEQLFFLLLKFVAVLKLLLPFFKGTRPL